MPTLTFTDGNDLYTVTGSDSYDLDFLGGDDTLIVNGGAFTTALMGQGDDVAELRSGDASVFGGDGNDRFEIYATGIEADGGDGADIFNIRGASGATLGGGLGADSFRFYGPAEDLLIYGGEGNDTFNGRGEIVGGSLYGGAGNDLFLGFTSLGALVLYGGEGNDVYRAHPIDPASIIEHPGEGIDTVQVSRGATYMLPANVEKLVVGNYPGSTSDTASLFGNSLDNIIVGSGNVESQHGYGGNDILKGNGGDDTLYGGTGDDRLYGGPGDDTLYGGDGNDRLDGGVDSNTFGSVELMAGGAGDDIYYVNTAADTVVESEGEGTDTVRVTFTVRNKYFLPANVENGYISGQHDNEFYGNTLDNVLIGSSFNEWLDGADGNDTVKGGAGHDIVSGSAGEDLLYGGAGDDTVIGGAHRDVMYGGTGADTFHYTGISESSTFSPTPTTCDLIKDFSQSDGDKINLQPIDANSIAGGDQPFQFIGTNAFNNVAGELRYEVISGITYIFGDVNGDGVADFMVGLSGSYALTSADFGL